MNTVKDGEYYIERLGRDYKIAVVDGLVVHAKCAMFKSDHTDYFISYGKDTIAKFISDSANDDIKRRYLETELYGLGVDLSSAEQQYRLGMDRLVKNVVSVKADISEVRKLLGDMNV